MKSAEKKYSLYLPFLTDKFLNEPIVDIRIRGCLKSDIRFNTSHDHSPHDKIGGGANYHVDPPPCGYRNYKKHHKNWENRFNFFNVGQIWCSLSPLFVKVDIKIEKVKWIGQNCAHIIPKWAKYGVKFKMERKNKFGRQTWPGPHK